MVIPDTIFVKTLIREKEEILSSLADMVNLMNNLHPTVGNEFKSSQRIKAEKILNRFKITPSPRQKSM